MRENNEFKNDRDRSAKGVNIRSRRPLEPLGAVMSAAELNVLRFAMMRYYIQHPLYSRT